MLGGVRLVSWIELGSALGSLGMLPIYIQSASHSIFLDRVCISAMGMLATLPISISSWCEEILSCSIVVRASWDIPGDAQKTIVLYGSMRKEASRGKLQLYISRLVLLGYQRVTPGTGFLKMHLVTLALKRSQSCISSCHCLLTACAWRISLMNW